MYTNLSYDLALAKQHDMRACAEKERHARQAAQASAGRLSGSRRGRRAWRLAVRLHPQVQS
jgi:hypothetical protein